MTAKDACHAGRTYFLLLNNMDHDHPIDVSKSTAPITRDQFMAFFRSGTFYEHMSDDDCREVFATVLKGGSDLTAEFLNDLLEDYSVEDVIVVNTKTLDWK